MTLDHQLHVNPAVRASVYTEYNNHYIILLHALHEGSILKKTMVHMNLCVHNV